MSKKDYYEVFEGNVEDLEKLKIRSTFDFNQWNKHLLVPLEENEIVFVHPDQRNDNPRYVRIIHSNDRVVSLMDVSYFESLN